MKTAFSFKTPIGYSIAGSFFLHIILVSMYGTLLTSREISSPPPPPKKFKIEMVTKKSKPVKKAQVIEKEIIKPKMVTPIKIEKSRTPYSVQKIIKKEITLSPVPQMVPAKPKKVQENNAHSSKQSFQMARADISANAVVVRPRKIENFQALEIITPKVQRSSTGKAKPADISPLPRPVKTAPSIFTAPGKETSFHKSAAGFAPSATKPKSISKARFSSGRGRATAHIHDGRKNIADGLTQARTISVVKNLGAGQKRAVKFKSGPPSRSLAPALAAIRPSTPEFESVKTPERTAKFYEGKIRTVSTLPSARVSNIAPVSSRLTGNNRRTGYVQKGELIAATTIPTPRPVPNIIDKRVLDGYLGTLQALIASAKKYPESARKSGQEGKVTVQFTVMKNGAVKNIQLVSKTNYADLNEEAIEAVKRAAPFSGLPDEIDKPFLDIILPFRFKLNE
jgi:TonB family protein